MRRRDVLAAATILMAEFPALGAEELEVEDFSLFAGPDMLPELVVGTELRVVTHGTKYAMGSVFARGRQIGVLENGGKGGFPPLVRLSRIERQTDGKHRVWVRQMQSSRRSERGAIRSQAARQSLHETLRIASHPAATGIPAFTEFTTPTLDQK